MWKKSQNIDRHSKGNMEITYIEIWKIVPASSLEKVE